MPPAQHPAERLRFCGPRCCRSQGGAEKLNTGHFLGLGLDPRVSSPTRAMDYSPSSPSSAACLHKAASFSLEVLNQKDSEYSYIVHRGRQE